MISISLIERSLDQQDHDRLLRDLAANGLTLPLSLRMQLCDSLTAIRGLALRRIVELTYGPTARSRELTGQLIRAVESETAPCTGEATAAIGSTSLDVLSLAAALAGLSRVATDQPAADDDKLRQTLDQGYRQLAALQDCDGLFTGINDRSLGDRALTTAFLLSLVGSCPDFTRQLRTHELQSWFDRHDGRLDRPTQQLWDLACIGWNDMVNDSTASTAPAEPAGLAA